MRLGTLLKGAMGRRMGRHKADPAAVERIRSWCRVVGDMSPDATLAINEIACTDPGCPGIETVILVMEAGRKTRAHKIAKPLDAVTEPDVRDVFRAFSGEVDPVHRRKCGGEKDQS